MVCARFFGKCLTGGVLSGHVFLNYLCGAIRMDMERIETGLLAQYNLDNIRLKVK